MSRIPYPDPATLSEPKQALVRRLGDNLLNISRMCMHAPDAQWAAQRELGQVNLTGTTLGARTREMVILTVAYLAESAYELHHHKSVGAAAGITEAEFEALRTRDFRALSPKDAAICQYVVELVRDIRPSDETLAAVRGHISDEHLFEILFLAGYYMIIARVIAVGDLEIDDIYLDLSVRMK